MNDTISRQAAIESLGEEPMVWNDEYDEIAEREQWRRDVAAIEAVPSAEPQIIQCKDCKWWTKHDTTLQGKCKLHGLNPMPEWYCASGEVGK